MMIGAQSAPTEARALQQAPPRRIHVPFQGGLPTLLLHRSNHEFRQVLALQRLPFPILQCLPWHAATRRPPLQSVEFFLGLAQRHRTTPLLAAPRLLAAHSAPLL